MVKITEVSAHSRAKKAGIKEGDILLSINGKEINDVLDYRFYLTEKKIMISVLREGKTLEFKIKKKEYDDIGLDFETPLMDKKHSCENKCVFCFIDQLPKGLRAPLYFKDDDSRLSFLHGNYITLTNLRDKDIDRIIEMHISPVNVSVHTTNPELRVKMMHNKRAGEVLSYLDRLANAGITLSCQIVLCKGLNDGAELERTMSDLERLYPAMQSTSVVPAGLTKFRDGLYRLEPFTPEECRDIIAQVNRFGEECLERHGTRLFYPADEFYIKGGVELPDDEFYEEYSQIENGVGMLTELETEFLAELECLEGNEITSERVVSVATGYAAYDEICRICRRLEAKETKLKVNVYPIKNNFFGEQITVSGLLTYTDMSEQLRGKELGECLLIPASTLRAEGDLFLDEKSPEELSAALGVPVRAVENRGDELCGAILGTI
ncbi:MAG: DUF512 domain-containing protein [Ruminococcaceae bacterium]|nr:DUF512 domain-containing protein [Oscillospiraceae bacterium]